MTMLLLLISLLGTAPGSTGSSIVVAKVVVGDNGNRLDSSSPGSRQHRLYLVWPDLKSSPPMNTSWRVASSTRPGTKVFMGAPLIMWPREWRQRQTAVMGRLRSLFLMEAKFICRHVEARLHVQKPVFADHRTMTLSTPALKARISARRRSTCSNLVFSGITLSAVFLVCGVVAPHRGRGAPIS